jgi:hypothetical protein
MRTTFTIAYAEVYRKSAKYDITAEAAVVSILLVSRHNQHLQRIALRNWSR